MNNAIIKKKNQIVFIIVSVNKQTLNNCIYPNNIFFNICKG